MAKAKYKQYFEEMFTQNRELFMRFKFLCDDYGKNKQKYKEQFDREGKIILEIVKDWEARLCGHMEKGDNAVFSSNLADKFWEEVRAYFPYIDMVGMKVRKI
ncbi:MAG: hypothetical protein ACOX6V_04185 [Patescibacteria group bacterium]|jgi:hypothetical protein